jgi:hypothetical protein
VTGHTLDRGRSKRNSDRNFGKYLFKKLKGTKMSGIQVGQLPSANFQANNSQQIARGASDLRSADDWMARLGVKPSDVRDAGNRTDNFYNFSDGRQVVISQYKDGGYTAEVIEKGGRVFGGSVYIQADPRGNTEIRYGAGTSQSFSYTLRPSEKVSLSKDGKVMITVNGQTLEARTYLKKQGYDIPPPVNPNV